MVHMVRNALKYVASKDMKSFSSDLKTTIYNAVSEAEGLKARERVVEKWAAKYPASMKGWIENWDVVVPILSSLRMSGKSFIPRMRLKACIPVTENWNRQRSVFPSGRALLKALYLATFEATKKWTQPIHNWGHTYGQMCIMYEGRLPY